MTSIRTGKKITVVFQWSRRTPFSAHNGPRRVIGTSSPIVRRLPYLVPAILGWVATAGFAQPAVFGPQESRYDYQLSETVQLDRADSAVKKQFEQASAYLADKQWSEAIDLLVQLVENWGGKLYGVTEKRYISVRDYCHLELASLPEEALAVYRTRVDAQAKKWYEEGVAQRDPRRLMEVVDHAFAGSWGDKALDALGEMRVGVG